MHAALALGSECEGPRRALQPRSSGANAGDFRYEKRRRKINKLQAAESLITCEWGSLSGHAWEHVTSPNPPRCVRARHPWIHQGVHPLTI